MSCETKLSGMTEVAPRLLGLEAILLAGQRDPLSRIRSSKSIRRRSRTQTRWTDETGDTTADAATGWELHSCGRNGRRGKARWEVLEVHVGEVDGRVWWLVEMRERGWRWAVG